ncbi:damage-inducible protein DinB [Pedobacter ginsengisoli]|uniref:Damage-inducible protein DinB n=1 Tax=Pedobacter ginsengisoli TaxID=363852 RepID=A0A2D1U1E2_9SPHI|nr:DinB family protein [Pedobacter ginsengisoli]ATP55409.1 damage-inducible protein DinB [Pedobacter ginsengisoli]
MLNQFCKYNNWANSLLLDTLISHSSSLPESCIQLFSHIVNAQTIWHSRINSTPNSISVWQLHDLETCKELLEESTKELTQIEQQQSIHTQVIKYTTSTGIHFETSVQDILLHVFNHGTYHRAQIAKEMKLHNLTPVNTDYIMFVRLQS